jgi:soluble lytic murein transglycosylase
VNLTPGSLRTALLVALLATSARAWPARPDTQDEAFLAARNAFETNGRGRLEKILPRLGDHLLRPYAEYWDLFLNLSAASPQEVRGFLSKYPGTVLAEQLRTDWLKVLGKNGRWDLFREEYPALAGDDPEVSCYLSLSRLELENSQVFTEFEAQWEAPRELPEACQTLAKALLKAGRLDSREVWNRFRVLVNADLIGASKRTMDFLPRGEAIEPKKLSAALRSPLKFLRNLHADLGKGAERELVIAALSLAADEDPLSAAEIWSSDLSEGFKPEDRNYVWLMLAMKGARRHVPEALEWFGKTGDRVLSDKQLAWRARIALRTKNWPQVRTSIDLMSRAAQDSDVWTYWYGRAERAMGNPLEAEGYFQRIAGEYGFYGRLAAEELGLAQRLPPRAPVPSEEEIAAAAAVPGLARALALYRLGMRTEATREWMWTIRGMDDRQLLAAAELARRNQAWDRAIGTADRTVRTHDFSVRYLAPYRDVLAQQARTRDLEEPLVLGLVRQESRFVTQAKSSNGAQGLMQVMHATAKWAAARMHVGKFSRSRLNEPDFNAALGTYYLRHVLDRFDGSLVLAAAAYNAGPSRARLWRGTTPVEGAIFAETIPFSETRDYVKKVLSNMVYYAAVLDGEQTSLKARLGTVLPPRSDADDITEIQVERTVQ